MENSNTTEANYQFNENVDCVTPTQLISANNCTNLSKKSINFPTVRIETPKRVKITSQDHESPNDGVINRLNNRKSVGFVTPQSWMMINHSTLEYHVTNFNTFFRWIWRKNQNPNTVL